VLPPLLDPEPLFDPVSVLLSATVPPLLPLLSDVASSVPESAPGVLLLVPPHPAALAATAHPLSVPTVIHVLKESSLVMNALPRSHASQLD
jgi:hypothetical protein